MDKNMLKNQWGRLKEDAQDHWDDLSREEVEDVNGDWYKLVRKLQEKYGYSKGEAEEEVEYFMSDTESDEYDEDEYEDAYMEEATPQDMY